MAAGRVVALVDGEHDPAVLRAALQRAGAEHEVVAAVLLGGTEKFDGLPDLGVPLEVSGSDRSAAVVAAAQTHGAGTVLDLSDEPVLNEAGRFELVAHALAAGLEYRGPDFVFRPPQRTRVEAPCLAVIGTGKRIGKTAVSAHAARTLTEAGLAVVVVAMGRGGPAEPTLVDPRREALGAEALLERARAGLHAASDYLEDAALAGVPTVGARRAGGGLAGTVYDSNVLAAARAAVGLGPDIVLLEGSGAAIPPVASQRTLLVTSAFRPVTTLTTGLGPYRVLMSDMVVLTMCEPPLASPQQIERTRLALDRVKPSIPVVATVLEPAPAEDVRGARVAYFTTAPAAIHDRLRDTLQNRHGAQVTAVVGSLSDRAALREAIQAPAVQSAEVFLTEIKAAGIDVVAMNAGERRVVFCDNRPVALPGDEPLEPAIERLAHEAVAAYA